VEALALAQVALVAVVRCGQVEAPGADSQMPDRAALMSPNQSRAPV
jgi:hypothetical protein